MKTLICTLFLILAFPLRALTVPHLQVGDVLLLSLKCYECRVIESETESLFSHSGVIIKDELGNIRVAQSLGKLDHFSYEEFTKNITPGTFVHVYRPFEFSAKSALEITFLEKIMLKVFNEKYKGAPFDSPYKWDNYNQYGEELLYCSEFIAKFLDNFLTEKTILAPISYSKHYDYWYRYFKGEVPEGELGNSPASFSRDHRFEFIGTI